MGLSDAQAATQRKHEHWPWREITRRVSDIDTRWFKVLFLDAEGNPMTQRIGFTENMSDDVIGAELAQKARALAAQGATFPEGAAWV